MANGHFAGGFAQSLQKHQELNQSRELKTRALDMQEGKLKQDQMNTLRVEAMKAIEGSIGNIKLVVENLRKSGTPLDSPQAQRTIGSIAQSALMTAAMLEQNGNQGVAQSVLGQIQALMTSPTAEEIAQTEGLAEAKKGITKSKIIAEETGVTGQSAAQAAGLIPGPQSTAGKLMQDVKNGMISPDVFKTMLEKELTKDPNISRDIVFPIISQTLTQGLDSLSDNQWNALELVARQTSGIKMETNRLARDILKKRPEASGELPSESVKVRFSKDKSMKGFKLGMKSEERGYEVLDDNGNLVGFFK